MTTAYYRSSQLLYSYQEDKKAVMVTMEESEFDEIKTSSSHENVSVFYITAKKYKKLLLQIMSSTIFPA
jgi:abortive infection bacteriophage resistance protein